MNLPHALGKNDEALRYFSNAIKKDSRHHIALLNAAKLHKQLENKAEASLHFDRYLIIVICNTNHIWAKTFFGIVAFNSN